MLDRPAGHPQWQALMRLSGAVVDGINQMEKAPDRLGQGPVPACIRGEGRPQRIRKDHARMARPSRGEGPDGSGLAVHDRAQMLSGCWLNPKDSIDLPI
jgi:hypothetical protein